VKKLLPKVAKALRGSSKGLTLIEVLIALTIFSIIAVAFLSGLATSYHALIIADERTTAESLTRSELEYIKSTPYSNLNLTDGFSYQIPVPPGPPPPWDPDHNLDSQFANYSVNVTGVPIDPDTHEPLGPGELDQGLQQITVKVSHGAKLVLTTVDYKVKR
jgi:prepilin-type N-terminal cleavage/methylation domain-containing protein